MSEVFVPERMRMSVDRYLKMIETGVLTKYDRIELIEGDMINRAPIGPAHSAVVARLNKRFVMAAGDSAIVSPAGSIRLGDFSLPQPDLMLLKPRGDFYSGNFPVPLDVLLVVEVSDSSLAYDQGTKRALYARYGVGEYWVADIPGRRLHVYLEPGIEGFAKKFEYSEGDVVAPWQFPAVQVVVGTMFK